MTDQNMQLIKKVLDYPENTAGGLMNTDLILIRPNHTLEVVLRYLRIKKIFPDATDSLFVVSKTNKKQQIIEWVIQKWKLLKTSVGKHSHF